MDSTEITEKLQKLELEVKTWKSRYQQMEKVFQQVCSELDKNRGGTGNISPKANSANTNTTSQARFKNPKDSSSLSFEIKKVREDNASLFDVFAYAIDPENYEKNCQGNHERILAARAIKKIISHYLLLKPNRYQKSELLEKSVEDYSEYIEKDDSMAGDIDIKILAEYYGIQFVIFSFQGTSVQYKYIPLTKDSANSCENRIFLIYDDNNVQTRNYDIIIARDEKNKENELFTFFGYDDHDAFDKAHTLAKAFFI